MRLYERGKLGMRIEIFGMVEICKFYLNIPAYIQACTGGEINMRAQKVKCRKQSKFWKFNPCCLCVAT